MNKYLSTFLALTFTASIASCSSTNDLTTANLDAQTPSLTGTEYNTFGQSTKRFVVSFKAGISDSEIQGLETKYKSKFKKIIPQIGIAIAEKSADAEETTEELSSFMKSQSNVEEFEPVNLVKLEKIQGSKANDPELKKQYHLDMINMNKAWSVTTGVNKIKIAIVDTGIDLNHPDLKSKIVQGANIVDPNQKPMDDNGHGTHVAGIAAAATDNKVGVAGIAPDCAIMPIKVLKNGSGTDIDIAEGIVVATDKGADVINISIGLYTRSTAMERAIKYAINKNVVVVSSSGNEGKSSKIHLPSMIKGVIEVSATTQRDKIASFSNYAQQISVSAPGDKIYSTMPTYKVELTSEAGRNYGILSGTSMASPIVAGLAALIKSEDKSMTPSQVKKRLESTAVDLGKKGYDEYYGYGRVDAYAALK